MKIDKGKILILVSSIVLGIIISTMMKSNLESYVPVTLLSLESMQEEVKTINNALKIPLNTLVYKDKKEGVWILKDNKAYFKALDIEAKSDDELAIKDGINKDDLILIPDNSKKPLSEKMRIH